MRESPARELAAETVTATRPAAARRCASRMSQVIGEQRVRFESDGVRTRITLELEVEPKEKLAPARRWWLRRKLRESLRRTLTRFSYELAADR